MEFKLNFNLLCVILVQFVFMRNISTGDTSEGAVDFYEGWQDCTKEFENAGYIDMKGLDILVEDDHRAYFNGTWKFLKNVEPPWQVHFYTEEYSRGAWVPWIVKRDIPDFCELLHKDSEVWYDIFKDQPGCPIKAGTEWRFDMVLIDLPIEVPSTYRGQYRLVFNAIWKAKGAVKLHCFVLKFDINEV